MTIWPLRAGMKYRSCVRDQDWDKLVQRLISNRAETLATLIPREIVEAAVESDLGHPLSMLFLTPTDPSVALTADALARVADWLETPVGQPYQSWWKHKIRLLRGDDAAGTLAELRAFGALLPALNTIGDGLDIRPYIAEGKAPDFHIIRSGDENVFVEVCCVRMNGDERVRLSELAAREGSMAAHACEAAAANLAEPPGSAVQAIASTEWGDSKRERHQVTSTAIRTAQGQPAFITTSIQIQRPQGEAKPEGDCHTVASRIANKKPPGQIDGKAGILWMDLCDPDWSMAVDNTRPVELCWKGLRLATTRGIWHAFYGRKDRTPIMERSAISFADGGHSSSFQVFDGRFRTAEQRCWSIAVLRCIDGIVLFEHPDPKVRIPLAVLRELVGIEGYAPDVSVHRFAEHDETGVNRRLDEIERMLAFYAA